MAKFIVVLEREECISCEACPSACPETFEMAEDGWATVKGSARVGSNDELETDDMGCSKEAAEGCPVNVIHVFEGDNKII
jgi:ferredoxin